MLRSVTQDICLWQKFKKIVFLCGNLDPKKKKKLKNRVSSGANFVIVSFPLRAKCNMPAKMGCQVSRDLHAEAQV